MKKYEYMEIEGGKQIHPGIAIAQAVQLLDLAASIATDARDVDRMVKVSTKWLSMGERLVNLMEENDEEETEEEDEKPESFGFTGGINKQILEKKEAEDCGPTTDDDTD